MKVGDLVMIVQSETHLLRTPFKGQVGVITGTQTGPDVRGMPNIWFKVMLSGNIRLFRSGYIKVLNESR